MKTLHFGGRVCKYLEAYCSTPKICVLPEFFCWNLNPSVMVFGVWAPGKSLGHEARDFINGIRALRKVTPVGSFACWAVVGHREKTTLREPGSGSWTQAEFSGILSLDVPASRSLRMRCLLLTTQPVLCQLQQPKWTKTYFLIYSSKPHLVVDSNIQIFFFLQINKLKLWGVK